MTGEVIDESVVRDGCTNANGTFTSTGGLPCSDGRMLFQMDASSGASAGWGFSGEKYTATQGDVTADPKYKAAYQKCQG